jgi:hypothetical protein
MSSKKPRSQTRLNAQEREMELVRQDTLVTADRTGVSAHKQIARVAKTIDNGRYPPERRS